MNKAEEINRFINKKINGLIAIAETGEGKYRLSLLRKGAGKKPGEVPELWGAFLQDMPEDFWQGIINPSKEEWACYIALTLYAIHQQGKDLKNHNMHIPGDSLGSVLYNLASSQKDVSSDEAPEGRMIKRMKGVASAKNIEGISYHLRQIVKMLSSQNIPMDYGMLAADLYKIQFRDTAYKTYLRWGQDFYSEKDRERVKENSNEKQEDSNE